MLRSTEVRRRAVMVLALLALGVGKFATEALHGTLATAALPFAIGLGYLLLYLLTGKDEKE